MNENNVRAEIRNYFDYVLPLVLESGKILLGAHNIEATIKNGDETDLVTIYDTKIEETLIRRIKEKYPTHKFIGEEDSAANGRIPKLTSDPTWIIDPIDGTTNFVKGLPLTCISVGLTVHKEQVMGIVYNPYMNELYTAIKGEGAYLNTKRIYTSGVQDIKESIFNYELSLAARASDKMYNLYMFRLKHLIKEISGVRSLGCVVIGLCYVACGRVDAYQCDGLYPWDAAAGTLIVREAGGHVVDTTGKEFDLMDPNYLAAATKQLADQYMKIEKEADNEMVSVLKSHKELVP